MTATIPPKRRATLEEWLARYEDNERLEIIDGEIVEKAIPSFDHSHSQLTAAGGVGAFNGKAGGCKGWGGWWLCTELHVGYANGDVYCHDLCGFRRDGSPERPGGFPVMRRPDWACEIVSPTHEKRDFVIKPTTLHAAEVPHYWVLDATAKLLLVHRWSPDGYVVVLRASAGDIVRAEPFDAIEIAVSDLFGDD